MPEPLSMMERLSAERETKDGLRVPRNGPSVPNMGGLTPEKPSQPRSFVTGPSIPSGPPGRPPEPRQSATGVPPTPSSTPSSPEDQAPPAGAPVADNRSAAKVAALRRYGMHPFMSDPDAPKPDVSGRLVFNPFTRRWSPGAAGEDFAL